MATYLTKSEIIKEATKLGGDYTTDKWGTFRFTSRYKAKEFRDWLAYNQQPARVIVIGRSNSKVVFD